MNPTALERFGWTEPRREAFQPFEAGGLVPGRVVLEHNHVYRVMAAEGERLAEVAGRLKHRASGQHALPVVGDWVALRLDPSGGRSQIREVLERQSWFSRRAAGRSTEEQVVAANIDTVFVVFGLDVPVKRRAIERYLVVARRSGAEPVVVLNKVDLVAQPALAAAEAGEAADGVPVVLVSTKTGIGLPDLEARLAPGRTVALIGPSGAGKSSIVNRLVGRELLPTGDVREWDARGRHTSVHRQLVLREAGGLVIDTPGMRELQLWESGAVGETFGDIAALADACRFRDCRHEREPGCAVKAAVDAGVLGADRLESFRKLQREQEAVERQREEREQIDARRQGRSPQRARTPRASDKNRDRRPS